MSSDKNSPKKKTAKASPGKTSKSNRVAILGGRRVPFCRSGSEYSEVGNFNMLTAATKALVRDFRLEGKVLGDVSLGALFSHSSDWNLSREVVLESGLSPLTPGFNVQRACGTSLSATIQIANKIALGQMDSGIAGGSDTNSDIPITYDRELSRRIIQFTRARSLSEKLSILSGFRPTHLKPQIPGVVEGRTGLSMGEHCELMAKEWEISRESQDQQAYSSHQNAVAAYERGFYDDMVVEYLGVKRDRNVRAETSLEKLAKLRPAFDKQGTLTAGNSTPLTDGAATVLLGSESWAKENGIPVQAYFVTGEVAAVDFVGGEGLLMAPTVAVARMLKRMNLKLQDFDFYEIHEAFSAQVLCTLKAWESETYCRERLGLSGALGAIDKSRMNVAGGSVALGHPFSATGARIVGSLAKLLNEKGKGRGLISVCTAGGMGVAAILER